MTHAPIPAASWCLEKGEHHWKLSCDHDAPCCRHSGHDPADHPTRSPDSVRTPDLDVPERLCPHGTRWNYTCDECEKVVEWYAAANDLYLVTHLHESDDCAECLAALHPASPQEDQEGE
jgi:hypothetical protein